MVAVSIFPIRFLVKLFIREALVADKIIWIRDDENFKMLLVIANKNYKSHRKLYRSQKYIKSS